MSSFVHLHTHSYYSLLEGAITLEELVAKAKAFKMPALALTDSSNLFAAVEFYQKTTKEGIKPILGVDLFFLREGSAKERDPRMHNLGGFVTLLAKNHAGYQNMCRLMSEAHLQCFYYRARCDAEMLRRFHEGLVLLIGCQKSSLYQLITNDCLEDAEKLILQLKEIFGENLYLELVRHGAPQDEKVVRALVALGQKLSVKCVATNDIYYPDGKDAELRQVLMAIQSGDVVDESQAGMNGREAWFKSGEDMQSLFRDHPEAVENASKLAETLNVTLDLKTYHFPKFEPPANLSLEAFFEQQAREGLEKRFAEIAQQRKQPVEALRAEYTERLEYELNMVIKMGFAGYFLIVADFIAYARQQNLPVGPGRGSAAGSLAAYCMGITNIDPIQHDLLFERFLNPERISMPDVDIDFCMRRRDEVIDYVAEKYGNVGQIITFGKMKAKAVLRDVGRALGMSYGEVDKIAKLVPATLNMTLELALTQEPKLKEMGKEDGRVARLLDLAQDLEGFPRHASTHAAGVVISDRPLTDYLPLCKGKEEEIVTQFDMKSVESVGLIKFDFLGLKTLTVIFDTVQLIKQHRNIDLNIDAIPLDDPLVYQKLSEGDTAGVFQLESQGMTALIQKLKPTVFADIVALVALFRPGPLGSGMVDDFIDRKHGRTAIQYPLPQLEAILCDTYGVIVYQEQVMRIASELASFSLGDADLLRRAMGKKKPEEMAQQREKFVAGAKKNGIALDKAEFMFDLMAKFAEYGFNKSHSAAYALVSYQTAYLKTHFTTEYLAAQMTCEQGNTDKILFSLADCKEHEIEVLPPDVNESCDDFTVAGEKQIRFGMGAVKNVGEAAVENIVAIRDEDGPFLSIFDFCKRVDSRKVNKRVIESLVKCGAFDFSKTPRSQMFAAIDQAMELASCHQKDRQSGQSRLFETFSEEGIDDKKYLPPIQEWQEAEKLSYEKESLGFYITGHPLTQYTAVLKTYATHNTLTLTIEHNNRETRMGGMVSRMREITTRKGDRMAFVTLEDLFGALEVIVFSDLYAEVNQLLKAERPIFVVGTVDADGETVKVIANRIVLLDEVAEHFTRSVHFKLLSEQLTGDQLAQLKLLLKQYHGKCPSYVHLLNEQKIETVLALPPELHVVPQPQLVQAVEKLFGKNVTHFLSSN